MTRLNKFLLILLLLHVFIAVSGQNYFSAENSKKFAEYLMDTKQYGLATDEFEKVVFLQPADTNALLLLIKSYRLNDQADIALNRIHQFYPKHESMPVPFAKEFMNNSLLLENFEEVNTFLSQSKQFSKTDIANYQLNFFILSRNWDAAWDYYQITTNNTISFLPELESMMKKKSALKYKSPLLSGTLSMIIPGMGKVYSNRWKDGLISFLFVGANAWQAYRGFKKDGTDSVFGWIMGSVAFSFYIGNIYGSVKATKKYNTQLNEQIYEEARYILHNHL